MALATTTLSTAVAVGDTQIIVASATSVAAGRLVRIDDEIMQVQNSYVSGTTVPVIRGLHGTYTAAHVITANVTHGAPGDFANAAPGQTAQSFVPGFRRREVVSLTATGTVTAPTPGNDKVIILNGTNAIAATLAAPTKDQDGDILYVVGNGKAAHTVTAVSSAVGFGNGGSSYDVLTFATGAQNSCVVMAANGVWVLLPSLIGGTATAVTATIA